MSCSIQHDPDAERLNPPDEHHQLGLLLMVETGARLVQQQQPRLGREGAGDLDPALLTVWELRDEQLLVAAEADEVEPAAGVERAPPFAGPVAPGILQSSSRTFRPIRLCIADLDVVERVIPEQAEILERPRHPVHPSRSAGRTRPGDVLAAGSTRPTSPWGRRP